MGKVPSQFPAEHHRSASCLQDKSYTNYTFKSRVAFKEPSLTDSSFVLFVFVLLVFFAEAFSLKATPGTPRHPVNMYTHTQSVSNQSGQCCWYRGGHFFPCPGGGPLPCHCLCSQILSLGFQATCTYSSHLLGGRKEVGGK